MYETLNKITVLLVITCTCTLFVFGKSIYQIFDNKYAKVKTVKAQVIDKFKADTFARIYSTASIVPQYYVVFRFGNKKNPSV